MLPLLLQAVVLSLLTVFRDFPKALYLSMFVQYTVFLTFGLVMYSQVGLQHMMPVALGSLEMTQRLICFAFLLPSVIILGSLYSAVTGRFIMFQIFKKSTMHVYETTVKGWATWVGVLGKFTTPFVKHES